MAENITNYTCPACTGPLQFSASTGKLTCEYCDSSFEVAEVEALYAQEEARAAAAAEAETLRGKWDASDLTEDWNGENIRAYQCPSCGAELLCDETTAATACPYCGNPSIVPGQFTGTLRPDYVLPFKLSKQEAIAKLQGHYKGKAFLPDTFLAKHTVEKIQGVYVPFWLYDGKITGDYLYKATRVSVHRQGEYEITATDHFQLNRVGSLAFEKVPVDASSKMPDDYMESIEPYDYTELKPFSTAYLPGFLADKYDVPLEQANGRADKRFVHTLEESFRETLLGYTTCVACPNNPVTIERGKVHYALLPVWLLNVKWNDTIYLFAVNGQTGKVCGRLPASKGKALAFFVKLAVSLSIAAAVLARMIAG